MEPDGDDGHVADDPDRFFGIPAEEFGGVRHFSAGVGQGLAVFEGDEVGDLLAALGHQLEAAAQDFGATARRRRGPLREGCCRGVDGGEAVLDVGVGDVGDDGSVGGVDHLDGVTAAGVLPVPGDQQLAGHRQAVDVERFLGGKESHQWSLVLISGWCGRRRRRRERWR